MHIFGEVFPQNPFEKWLPQPPFFSGSTGHQCDDFGHPATNQGGNANFEKLLNIICFEHNHPFKAALKRGGPYRNAAYIC